MQQQNQQQIKQKTSMPLQQMPVQQIPAQQKTSMIQQQMPMQQRSGLMNQQIPMRQQQNQMIPQQMQMNDNNIMQASQYRPNAMTMGRPYPIPMQMPPFQMPLTPKTMELVIRKDDKETDKTERTNETFEKMLQFMTIVGQVDTYLSEKAQSAIRTIAKIAAENKGTNSSWDD